MKLTKLRTFASLITVAAVAGVVALAIPANGTGTADNRFITVTGVGTISVVPDAVRFNATVSTVGSTNAAALSSASKSAAAVRAALIKTGIATKIFVQQTSAFTLNTTGPKKPAQRSLVTVHHNHLMF
jgi:uncharacterized protein YggE